MPKLLTVEDLRNPKRKSGFDHVNSASPGAGGHAAVGPRWRAAVAAPGKQQKEQGIRHIWRGPARRKAEEAAQDYCDYVNGQQVALAPKLNGAGHEAKRDSLPMDPEVEAALGVLRDAKARRRGRPGYVYCIGVEGDATGVKIGYSVKPEARVGELQSGNPRKLVLLGFIKGTEGPAGTEGKIHARYIEDNLVGEWFRPTGPLLSEFGITWTYFVRRCHPSSVNREAAA